MLRSRLLLTTTAAAATCLPAGVAGAETRLLDVPSARPGQTVHLRAITTGSERCTLRIAGRSKSLAVTGFTRSRFTVRVSRRARPGRYPILLRCHETSDAAVLRVSGRRARASSRRRIVAGPIRARAYRRPIQPGSRQVTAVWREEKPMNDDWFLSPGDELSWAYRRRPDVVEAAERRSIADALNDRWPDGDAMITNWDASSWDDNAVDAGLPVSAFPRVGALMVWHRSPVDADLAYVEQVLPGGAIVVSQMGAPNVAPHTVTRATVTAAQRGAAPEVVFIHRAGETGL
jgi:hypothetical protein